VFVFDDEPAIVENPNIRRLWPLTGAIQSPPGTTVSGRPLISLTLAVNYALAPGDARDVLREPSRGAAAADVDRFRRNLWGYHAFNVLVHLAAALTLYGVVRRTLSTAPLRARIRQHADRLSLAIALIWVVHPLTTGAVTYVVQRAESVMALFFLATVYCAIRAWGASAAWTAAAAICCALGMASKESMAAAPLVVLLWDLTFSEERRSWAGLFRQRRVLYLALASTWILLALLVAGGHRSNAVGFGFDAWPWWRYLATQTGVIVHYLRLVVFPSPLVLDYAWPPAVSLSQVLLPALVVGVLVTTTILLLVRRSPLGFAAGTFFLVLAPTSSVIPIVTEVAAEHRMYLPLAAVLAMVVTGIFVAAERLKVGVVYRLLAIAAVVVTFVGLTIARNRDYHSFERIWMDTIQKRPANARARNNYATALLAEGRFRQAEDHLRVALRLQPDYAEARGALGSVLCAQGRLDEGIEQLEQAVARAPGLAAAQQSLGEAHASRGRMDRALEHYFRALEVRRDDVILLNRIGWILATDTDDKIRDGARALELATHAVDLTGHRDVTSLDTLAAAQAERGEFQNATATAREALALARAKGERGFVAELGDRLVRYKEGRPFRQSRAK
jgi:tetratricopeptide (TPR) repeat protein